MDGYILMVLGFIVVFYALSLCMAACRQTPRPHGYYDGERFEEE